MSIKTHPRNVPASPYPFTAQGTGRAEELLRRLSTLRKNTLFDCKSCKQGKQCTTK